MHLTACLGKSFLAQVFVNCHYYGGLDCLVTSFQAYARAIESTDSSRRHKRCELFARLLQKSSLLCPHSLTTSSCSAVAQSLSFDRRRYQTHQSRDQGSAVAEFT